ncbi:MAG: hypothetical protein ISR65_16680 [Bacteriovoracaceae bacterium]|nr:hypothetical protein [Bacteriovoracaceae bacterium]
MKKVVSIIILVFGAYLLFSMSAHAEGKAKLGGKVYFDWNYGGVKDQETSGFELRRFYLTHKYQLNKKYQTRVTYDVGRTADQRLVAYLKYGYITMKKVLPMTKLTLGLHGLKQFSIQEKAWGYRYVFKSFQDNNKFGTSADLGFTAEIAPMDMVKIYLTLVNGEGYKLPQDAKGTYKSAFGLQLKPMDPVKLYFYFDRKMSGGGEISIATFASYTMKKVFKIAAEYNIHNNKSGTKDNNLTGMSFYFTYFATKKIDVFGRYDALSSKDDWNGSDGSTIIAGLQYKAHSKFLISPNVQFFKGSGANSAAKTSNYILNFEYKL